MINSRVMLFGILIALILFCSLCMFTVSPYEHALVECFGAQVTPLQILGEPPGWIVTDPGQPGARGEVRWAQGVVIPDSVYEAEKSLAEEQNKRLPYTVKRAPLGSGLFLKLPAPFHRVHRFENRLKIFKENLKEIHTRTSEPIMVQPYILWQIQDPVQYWKSGSGDENTIDDKLESRLTSTLQALIGERYGVEDFYSLDQQRLRELMDAQRRRLLAVIASPEVEKKIEADVEELRRRRLPRMTPERYEELAAAKVGSIALLNLTELAEAGYIYWSHLRDRQSRPGFLVEPGAEFKGKSVRDLDRELLNRQLSVPSDAMKRERGLTDEQIERVKAVARRLAVEDILAEEAGALWGRVAQVLLEMRRDGRLPGDQKKWDPVWKEAWKGKRLESLRLIHSDAVARLRTYVIEDWKISPADFAASHAAAIRTFHGASLAQLRSWMVETGSPGFNRETEAAIEFEEKAVQAFAESVAGSLGLAAGPYSAVQADALFRLMFAAEGRYLGSRRDLEDRKSRLAEGAAGARAADGPDLPELVAVRNDREHRIADRMRGGLEAGTEARVRAAALAWAQIRFNVESEALKERTRLQDVRGYPRKTVEEMKAQIDALERDLAQSSLGARNTVKIAEMESLVRAALNRELIPQYGIVIREVGIRRLSFPPSVSAAIYGRMKAERERIQRTVLATGRMEAQAIITQAKSRKDMTISEADAEAVKIKGEGQAQALSVMAEVVDNFELFKLMQDLAALEAILSKPNTTLILQAGKDPLLMRFFNRSGGAPYEVRPDGGIESLKKGVIRPDPKKTEVEKGAPVLKLEVKPE